jgi:ribosomal protein L19E
MKQLRQYIRQIILEGFVKDEFKKALRNAGERLNIENFEDDEGTFHRDAISKMNPYRKTTEDFYDRLFKEKRDLKRLWNKTIDANGLRSFWEGPKMKYFHSLSYYSSPSTSVDKLQSAENSDLEIKDLAIAAFLQKYKLKGNRDEMSTYGVYLPDVYSSQIMNDPSKLDIGVLLKGRVTIASSEDAYTESRSKATKKDMQRHKHSGMPKRIVATDFNVDSLVFEEEDIKEMFISECVLDNWGIEAIVYNPKKKEGAMLEASVKKLSKQYGIPFITVQDAFGI